MKPVSAALAALLIIVLLGIAGTPEYVLDVERENDALRAELKRATLAINRSRLVSAECGQPEAPGLLVQVAK